MPPVIRDSVRQLGETYASHVARALKIKPTASDQIDAALELVLELAFQNTTDRYDNPSRYRREIAAINLVRETFTKSGERKW